MPEGMEPNISDIFASKFGVTKNAGEQLAVQFLLAGLLIRLREKGILDNGEITVLLDATSIALAEPLDRSIAANPAAAEHISEMKAGCETALAIIRGQINPSDATDQKSSD